MEKLKGDSLAVVEYHLWDDPFENSDADGRQSYYNINLVPTAKFDGRSTVAGPNPNTTFDEYLSAYDDEMSYPSTCLLDACIDYDSTTKRLWVKARVTAVDTFSNAHLRYVIAESHIHYHWWYSDSLHHVVRKMLPDYNGIAFNIQPGEAFVDSQTYVLDPSWNYKNCYVVVFVQRDDLDKPILRSAKCTYFTWIFGNANGDGAVTISDIVYLINYLFWGGPPPVPLAAGDPNNDCVVDGSDVVYLINYIFKNGPAPLKGCVW